MFALLLLAAGCRSKPPTADTLCWEGGGVPTPNPFDTECEPRMCFDEVQRDTLVGSRWICPNWTTITPDNLSTDADPKELQFVYAEGIAAVAHFIDVRFDNRVAIDPSLEKFQQYVIRASGTYETYQGEMKFSTTQVEVLDYAGGWLKVRIHATFDQILYASPDPTGGFDICSYRPTLAGSDPELGELDVIVDAPVDTTPNSP